MIEGEARNLVVNGQFDEGLEDNRWIVRGDVTVSDGQPFFGSRSARVNVSVGGGLTRG